MYTYAYEVPLASKISDLRQHLKSDAWQHRGLAWDVSKAVREAGWTTSLNTVPDRGLQITASNGSISSFTSAIRKCKVQLGLAGKKGIEKVSVWRTEVDQSAT